METNAVKNSVSAPDLGGTPTQCVQANRSPRFGVSLFLKALLEAASSVSAADQVQALSSPTLDRITLWYEAVASVTGSAFRQAMQTTTAISLQPGPAMVTA